MPKLDCRYWLRLLHTGVGNITCRSLPPLHHHLDGRTCLWTTSCMSVTLNLQRLLESVNDPLLLPPDTGLCRHGSEGLGLGRHGAIGWMKLTLKELITTDIIQVQFRACIPNRWNNSSFVDDDSIYHGIESSTKELVPYFACVEFSTLIL